MLGFIFADLRRHALGAAAIMLLIALATGLGIAVTLQERALRLGSARAAAAFDLVVGAPGSETQLVLSSVFLQPSPLPLLPGDVLAKLRADPRVAFAAPVGFGDFAGDDPIVGTTADVVNGLGSLREGRSFERLNEAIAGSAVERNMGAEFKPFHGRLSEGGHVHAQTHYRIVGRMAPTGTPWDRAIFVPIQAVWQAHAHEPGNGLGIGPGHERGVEVASADASDRHDAHDHGDETIDMAELSASDAPGVPAILVKPRTIADAYKLRQEYRSERSLAVFPAEVLTRLYGTLGDARTVLSAVAIGAQLLVGAAILLVVAIHVLQRGRQIGALRAFGAPRGAVFALVWLETFAVIGVGVVLGFGIGYGGALAASDMIGAQAGIALPVVFRREDLWSLLTLFAGTAVVTLVPAALAYRQSPAQALRN